MFSSTYNSRNPLRRSLSARSMRKSRRPTLDDATPPIPSFGVQHSDAAAAASSAMRSGQSPSRDSRRPYDGLGRLEGFPVPRRLPDATHQSSCENPFMDQSMDQQDPDPAAAAQRREFKQIFGHPYVGYQFENNAGMSPLFEPGDLEALMEPGGLDGRNSTVPSSDRRQVRKSKSMFSTRQRTSQASPEAPPPPGRRPVGSKGSPGFRLPRSITRSMSFHRGHRSQQEHRDLQNSQEVVDLARNYFEQSSFEGDSSDEVQKKSVFPHRRKREHKPFRKTFRDTSGCTASPSTPTEKNLGGFHKHRSLSNSIKNGFKRVFGLSKGADVTTHPSPLSGYSNSVGEAAVTPSKRNMDMEGGTPSRQTVRPQYSRAISRSPSWDSPYDSKSRVTSWADSSLTNTVTTRKPGHQRSLTSIREDENLNKRLPPTPARLVSGTKEPLHSVTLANPNLRGIDSRDLCSALKQQITRNQPTEPNEALVFGRVPERRVVPETQGSDISQYGRRTVRHIPSQEASISPESFSTARGEQSSAQKHHLVPAKSLKLRPSKSSPLRAQQEDDFSERLSSFPVTENSFENSSSLMSLHIQDARGIIRSPSFGFGPGDSLQAEDVEDIGRLLVRRARESRERIDTMNNLALSSGSNIRPRADLVEDRDLHNAFRARRVKRDYSPSVYSRTSSGVTLPRPDANIVDSNPHDGSGTATIFSQQRTAYISPRHPAPHTNAENYSKTSAEWRQWTDSELGKLGQTQPPREHIREYEQFQDDDEQWTTIAREKNNDAISPPTRFQTSNFTTPPQIQSGSGSVGKEHTGQRTTSRNFSRPYTPPSARKPVPGDGAYTDSPKNTDDSTSPTLVLQTRLQNQIPMSLGSEPLPLPETPTPKTAARKRVFAEQQRRQYAARRAAIAEFDLRTERMRQEQFLNDENHPFQPKDSTNPTHRVQKFGQACEELTSSNEMVKAFLNSRRGQQDHPAEDDEGMGRFL
ncbi:hypothetical protein N7535_003156 [Penicillium sp. DV-2018c]|nr:hypothetical protein N7461_001152 [Penicillium sp. DV-2018c]KAJ5576230.1 hypothetical protein N7535_003156 [Penicillium sp. DV-2018c]